MRLNILKPEFLLIHILDQAKLLLYVCGQNRMAIMQGDYYLSKGCAKGDRELVTFSGQQISTSTMPGHL